MVGNSHKIVIFHKGMVSIFMNGGASVDLSLIRVIWRLMPNFLWSFWRILNGPIPSRSGDKFSISGFLKLT